LRAKLAQGDKALVGNSGFRRYLKTVSRVLDDPRFVNAKCSAPDAVGCHR
jgi:hypothetical protein